tara:strand:+ start:777 stop:1043 length:267 start_codon:yes stop_codon:yes gene_type:complete
MSKKYIATDRLGNEYDVSSNPDFIRDVNELQKELPTFHVTQLAKVKYTWIVQAKNKEEAEDIAMTSEADNEESIETLDLVVYAEEELK